MELQAATRELKAANERLQEIDRLKDDFMSSVTHELRTPLTSIRAFSEILYEDPKVELAERKRFLGIIVSETERLSRLVNQVLDLAKIESGHADWQVEEVDLRDLVQQASEATETLFGERGAQLSVHLPQHPCTVLGDRDRLIQVLVNLLANAVKFTPPDTGRVRIRLLGDEMRCRVSVTDNGPGIAPAERQYIFERFHQGSDGPNKPAGTGLGLPISREIIEHLGGRIWVESLERKGATFTFELPSHPLVGEANVGQSADSR